MKTACDPMSSMSAVQLCTLHDTSMECGCRLRDEVLPELGVLLQDKPDDTSEWVLEDPAVLAAEAEQKRR